MKKMVVGFIFNLKGDEVLLIKKTHPDWQKGKLNGLGGHLNGVELDNMDYQGAFVREVKEESGLVIQKSEAKWVARIWGRDFNVPVYAYKLKSDLDMINIHSPTDEKVGWYPAFQLDPKKVIINLTILVPFAWYVMHSPSLKRAKLDIEYA